MTENITLIQAENKHLPEILEIWNYEILNSTSIFEETPIDLKYVEKWMSQRMTDGFPVIVAMMDSKVIAYGSYGKFRDKSGYTISVENSIYIHQDYRGRGTGKIIMRELLKIAKDRDVKNVIAVIDASNYKSIRFHEKFGFIEAGRLERIAKKFDKFLDAVILQHQIYR